MGLSPGCMPKFMKSPKSKNEYELKIVCRGN
jgi:hypothetical protein